MAGTVTVTTDSPIRAIDGKIIGRKLVINATADASDGSFPTKTLRRLNGYLQPIVTNPGSTAPTDNYDVAIYHADDSTANLTTSLTDRDTANTEVAVATLSGSATPVHFSGGNYTLAITGNSVNSATTQIILEILAVTR